MRRAHVERLVHLVEASSGPDGPALLPPDRAALEAARAWLGESREDPFGLEEIEAGLRGLARDMAHDRSDSAAWVGQVGVVPVVVYVALGPHVDRAMRALEDADLVPPKQGRLF